MNREEDTMTSAISLTGKGAAAQSNLGVLRDSSGPVTWEMGYDGEIWAVCPECDMATVKKSTFDLKVVLNMELICPQCGGNLLAGVS